MKLLDKLNASGSLQIAMVLTAAMVAMLILEQLGHGFANREFLTFAFASIGYVMGRRNTPGGA